MAITDSTVAMPAGIRLIGKIRGVDSRSHASGGNRVHSQQLWQQEVEAEPRDELLVRDFFKVNKILIINERF